MIRKEALVMGKNSAKRKLFVAAVSISGWGKSSLIHGEYID